MRWTMKALAIAVLFLFAAAWPAPAQTAHTVNLSWTASTSAGVGYNVYRGTVSGGPYTLLNAAPLGTATLTYADATVTEGNKYFYVVRAVLNGLESVNSNEATVSIPPAPPTALKVVSVT